jgi:hypothetical protein
MVMRVVAAALALTLAWAARAGFDVEQWSHHAEIQLAAPHARGVAEVRIEGPVFDLARPDLADLRVLDDEGSETGYVLRRAEAKSSTATLDVKLYNRTYDPGRQSSVTADFGGRVMKNRLRVRTSGQNFRRRVSLEASDDAEAWKKVRDDGFLFHIPPGPGSGFERDVVEFPDGDHRYVRLTVFNGPEDPERVEIASVEGSRVVLTPAETQLVSAPATIRNENRTTLVMIDAGWRNVPLHDVKLAFTDDNFFRRVSVHGRNAETRMIRTLGEGGAETEQTIDEPWQPITSAAIYRFTGGGATEDSQVIPLRSARYRYLRIAIENGDDPPLERFNGADLRATVCYLTFPVKAQRRYSLYMGNPRAAPPSYDVVHYIERLRGEAVTTGVVGNLIPSADYGRPRELPWSERHKGPLWVALLLAAGLLAALLFRQARSGARGEKSEDGC